MMPPSQEDIKQHEQNIGLVRPRVFHADDYVIWKHELRGGYGWIEFVPATVKRVGNHLVRIAFVKVDGTPAQRSVWPKNLRHRQENE